ncbi:helix-turn-helix domain-containing protein [Methylococcus mesophilus]|uniref:helix-turn-helix domain-containing protein n=1 Tax=Methylococcus mesophilus TaxID=2993564 RepID=UPI00374465C9
MDAAKAREGGVTVVLLLNLEEVAQRLGGVSARTVWRMIAAGDLKAARVPRLIRGTRRKFVG